MKQVQGQKHKTLNRMSWSEIVNSSPDYREYVAPTNLNGQSVSRDNVSQESTRFLDGSVLSQKKTILTKFKTGVHSQNSSHAHLYKCVEMDGDSWASSCTHINEMEQGAETSASPRRQEATRQDMPCLTDSQAPYPANMADYGHDVAVPPPHDNSTDSHSNLHGLFHHDLYSQPLMLPPEGRHERKMNGLLPERRQKGSDFMLQSLHNVIIDSIEDYMVENIRATCCCFVFGIYGLYKAILCKLAKRRGDVKSARKYSKAAKILARIGTVIGTVLFIVYLGIGGYYYYHSVLKEEAARYYASFYVTEESPHDRPLHKENSEGMNINL